MCVWVTPTEGGGVGRGDGRVAGGHVRRDVTDRRVRTRLRTGWQCTRVNAERRKESLLKLQMQVVLGKQLV